MKGNDGEMSSYCMDETPLVMQGTTRVRFNGTRSLLVEMCPIKYFCAEMELPEQQ